MVTSDQHRVAGEQYFPKSGLRARFSLSITDIVCMMFLVACGDPSGQEKQVKDIQIDIQADWEYTDPPSGSGTFTLKGSLTHADLTGTLQFSDENGNVIYDESVTGGLHTWTMRVFGGCEFVAETADLKLFIHSSTINPESPRAENFCPCCNVEADMITNGDIDDWKSGIGILGTWRVKATQ